MRERGPFCIFCRSGIKNGTVVANSTKKSRPRYANFIDGRNSASGAIKFESANFGIAKFVSDETKEKRRAKLIERAIESLLHGHNSSIELDEALASPLSTISEIHRQFFYLLPFPKRRVCLDKAAFLFSRSFGAREIGSSLARLLLE